MSRSFPGAPAAAAALLLSVSALTSASAHVTLETQQAVAGSYFKAVMRVPHGCEGAATIRVRIQIPDGVLDIKPMPKPGWELATVKGKLAEPYKGGHGELITEGVREVAWSGGKLPDDNYDEFVMRVRLPNTPGVTLAWAVVQDCEGGKATRWIEIPAAGQSADDLKAPATFLKLLPKP